MKKITALILVLLSINLIAQPDIKRNIFIKQKICTKSTWGLDRVKVGDRIFEVGNYYPIGTQPDALLIIMDLNFDTIKTVVYGGSQYDGFGAVNLLPNGHLLLTGITGSKDGDVPYGHAYSVQEIWMLEVDTNGVIIKGKTFGGSGGSGGNKPVVTKDGFIYFGGSTLAKDYDFAHNSPYGIFDDDPFFVKLDTALNLIWVKTYTTAYNEGVSSITEINDNHFIINIQAIDSIPELDGANAKGKGDMVLICIDSSGTELWKRRYGGSSNEGASYVFHDSIYNYIYTVGGTSSKDGDISYRTGTDNVTPTDWNSNIWVCKLDMNGILLYSKAYGSLKDDVFTGYQATFYNNQLWVSFTDYEDSGDCSSTEYPTSDTLKNAWIGLVDSQANLIGTFVAKSNGNISIGGGFISFNNNLYALGGSDSWKPSGPNPNTYSCDTSESFQFVLNLGDAPLGVSDYEKKSASLFQLYPNPSNNQVNIKLLDVMQEKPFFIEIFNADGKQVYSKKISNNSTIDISSWAQGLYYCKVSNKQFTQTISFFKQ